MNTPIGVYRDDNRHIYIVWPQIRRVVYQPNTGILTLYYVGLREGEQYSGDQARALHNLWLQVLDDAESS